MRELARLGPRRAVNRLRLRRPPDPSGAVGHGPDSLMLFITGRCNLACRMCPFPHGARRGPAPGLPDMDLGNYRTALARAATACSVGLVGGEPLLHPELPAMIQMAAAGRRQVAVATNGLGLDDETRRKLLDSPLASITVSLDAVDPAGYARLRGGTAGQFHQVLRQVEALAARRRPGLAIEVSHVTGRSNLAEALDFVALGRNLGVDTVRFQNVIHYDCSPLTAAAELLIDAPELRAVLAALRAEDGRGLRIIAPVAVPATVATVRCRQPFRLLAVDSLGNVSPCCVVLPAPEFGNLLVDPNAFAGSPLAAIRRSMLDGSPARLEICRTCAEHASLSS